MDARLKAALASALGSELHDARARRRRHQRGLRGRAGRRPPPVRRRRTSDRRPGCSPRRRGASPGSPRRARCGSRRWWRCPAPDDPQQFLVLELVGDRRARRATSTRSWGRGWPRCIARARPASASTTTTSSARCRRPMPPPSSWPEFYRARRLEAQLRRAADEGLRVVADAAAASIDCSGCSTSSAARPSRRRACTGICGAATFFATKRGAPCLIDPAVYGGHREIDLAMMRLFGGFGARVFDAYDEAWPLADGHARAGAALPALPADGARESVRRQLRRDWSRRPSRGCVRFASL